MLKLKEKKVSKKALINQNFVHAKIKIEEIFKNFKNL